MSKETLDCRGLACPQPVVETKKKLAMMPFGVLTVLVDNYVAKENLIKLADSLHLEAMACEEDGLFTVTVLKEEGAGNTEEESGNKVLLITADTFGRGNEELGSLLTQSFFYALAESDKRITAVYLVNSGVKLACDGSAVLDSLGKLEELGVSVYACGLCLDFFQLKENLRVGGVTNMYAIVEALVKWQAVIL
ncbi:MAG: sulfurtransferase-like selenium metabolism protein YedF [Dethiobacter sp.]|nr:sulfurtransferase-like selenium metabolism protein YedF [Dethiobacter sp.]MBS3898372.1 sulfurtransferase-like selenium metabolism protein YedF [Dethiobacter sp.]MBS3983657.1 sulfurtransferase-like selenium metabolism protein YedF [Dethiobacter sp.]MCL4462872.1 sulfurtransferase-like selenium metabolism protein YedF [Bacillota bacterium]MCL5993631.1 sulfurtransferase-like selenium metabolism protein YedF [Bacillota bacterium]